MKKYQKNTFLSLFFIFIFCLSFSTRADLPRYAANPFTFAVEDSVYGYGCGLFAVDLNGDTLPDFTYRSITHLFAYDHYGTLMWKKPISYPGVNINVYGSKHGAADLDGDGQIEVAALNDSNRVIVLNGLDGSVEKTFVVSVDPYQKAGCIAVANFRGEGDRDIVVQTVDVVEEGHGMEYYLNRSILAIRMDTQEELWRVGQDRDPGNGIYEGYWGPAHGAFQLADVDEDGKDEIVGGNMIDDDGRVIDLGYPRGWIKYDDVYGFVDHLDAVAVGDYRPDLPGLEWSVCEEDWFDGPTEYYAWNTTLMSKDGILWRKKTLDFPETFNEPQQAVGGNFSLSKSFDEIWVSSRLPNIGQGYDSQRPWVFDGSGEQIAAYSTNTTLPSGFNSHENGNGEGIEPSCTIDWYGGKKEYLAARARHVSGNIGVLDAMSGTAVWSTVDSIPSVKANSFYVADVSGDAREEIVVHDQADGKIKIYRNGNSNPNQPKPSKWDDPLYRRIKQNYNLYSSGGYTYGDYPLISEIRIDSITTNSVKISWDTDQPSGTQAKYGFTSDYGQVTPYDPSLVASHVVRIQGLLPNRPYHFQIESENRYHKLGLSKDTTFQTLPVYAEVKVFLEGPYSASGDTMGMALLTNGYLPKTSPYSEDSRTVATIPADVVDWVLIQLRAKADSAAVVSRSVFVKKNGTVVAENGIETKIEMNAVEGYYFIVIRHRNHLAVMSAEHVELKNSGTILYDFTRNKNQYYGTDACKELEPSLWGLWAGDINQDKQITTMDYTSWYNSARVGDSGYRVTDINFDGQVTTMDYTLWYNNARLGASSKVP